MIRTTCVVLIIYKIAHQEYEIFIQKHPRAFQQFLKVQQVKWTDNTLPPLDKEVWKTRALNEDFLKSPYFTYQIVEVKF